MMWEYGNSLKSLRKKSRLSQAELAEMCDVTQGAISFYERGVNIPSGDTLTKICAPLRYRGDRRVVKAHGR
jgi:transcriptional regulator with XRE-family HTH domain